MVCDDNDGKGRHRLGVAAGHAFIGLWALSEEFDIIMEIAEQYERLERSISGATIATSLCAGTRSDSALRVPAMYAYMESADNVAEAFAFENPIIWLVGILTGTGYSETVGTWAGARDEFAQKLQTEWAVVPPSHSVHVRGVPSLPDESRSGASSFQMRTTTYCTWIASTGTPWITGVTPSRRRRAR